MSTWPIHPYTPRHTTFPYTPSDFTRSDSSNDTSFYTSPRFVTHIDDAAIARLSAYYSTALPRRGRFLDLCSSWISHYPREISDAVAKGDVRVLGMGMNRDELDTNEVLNGGRVVLDLNALGDGEGETARRVEEAIGGEEKLVATTCVVSIDYLVRPVEVLRGVRAQAEVGGKVHLVVSNRCFPTKAISRWLRVGEEERLQMVGDFLWFAGWRGIEIVDLCERGSGRGGEGGLGGFMGLVGLQAHRDPLWVVRAVKED